MTCSSSLLLCLVLQVMVQGSFSYPYPSRMSPHPMRRQMISSGATETWVPYPIVLPNYSSKMAMPDYPGSASFLRPPMPRSSPLLPSSSFLVPSITSPPRPPVMAPISKTTHASDRSFRPPQPRNKEDYRQRIPRPKKTYGYIEKDWPNQDEMRWRKRFNLLDQIPNEHQERYTHSSRRIFGPQKPRRTFADSEERNHRLRQRQRQRDFSQERQEDSQENQDDSDYRKKKPMMQRKHESDETERRDSYYRRDHHNDFRNKDKRPPHFDRHRFSERNTIQSDRRRGHDRHGEELVSKFDQKNSFRTHRRMGESKAHRIRDNSFKENSFNRHNSLNKESEEFQKIYNGEDEYSEKLKSKKPKMVKPVKAYDEVDSAELRWSSEDSAERKGIDKSSANRGRHENNGYARRYKKDKEKVSVTESSRSGEDFGRPTQRIEKKSSYDAKLYDSSPSPGNSERREDFVKPKRRPEKKSFDDTNLYDSLLLSEMSDSGEEFRKVKQSGEDFRKIQESGEDIRKSQQSGEDLRKAKQSEKKSSYDTNLHETLPPPENSESGEDFRKPSNERIEKKSFDDVKLYDSSPFPSLSSPKSIERSSDSTSAEANKKDSWNCSSREIIVKDDEVSDTNTENGNYDNHKYEATESEDKEDTEIVESSSDLLKIPNTSENSTIEKSYIEDTYTAEALTSHNNSTSTDK